MAYPTTTADPVNVGGVTGKFLGRALLVLTLNVCIYKVDQVIIGIIDSPLLSALKKPLRGSFSTSSLSLRSKLIILA